MTDMEIYIHHKSNMIGPMMTLEQFIQRRDVFMWIIVGINPLVPMIGKTGWVKQFIKRMR